MFESFSAFGSFVQTPCGPRKSGIRDSVEIPAPVNTTTREDSSTQRRASAIAALTWSGLLFPESPYAARRCLDHLRRRRATERFLELGHVRDDAVGAEAAWRMRIRASQQARDLVGPVLAPHLSPTDEESLLGREAIRLPQVVDLEALHQRHPSEAQAAIVGRVLAERQPSIQLHVGHGRESGVLLRDTVGAFFERLSVGWRPPVAQI